MTLSTPETVTGLIHSALRKTRRLPKPQTTQPTVIYETAASGYARTHLLSASCLSKYRLSFIAYPPH